MSTQLRQIAASAARTAFGDHTPELAAVRRTHTHSAATARLWYEKKSLHETRMEGRRAAVTAASLMRDLGSATGGQTTTVTPEQVWHCVGDQTNPLSARAQSEWAVSAIGAALLGGGAEHDTPGLNAAAVAAAISRGDQAPHDRPICSPSVRGGCKGKRRRSRSPPPPVLGRVGTSPSKRPRRAGCEKE